MSVDALVEQLPIEIGQRVRAERLDRGLTLDELAEASGVSRRMIVNIEAGSTNPSIATLLRVSAALQITLGDLVAERDAGAKVTVRHANSVTPLWRGQHGGAARLMASTKVPESLELWEWVMESGDLHDSPAHAAGTQEFLFIHAGRLLLTVADQQFILRRGDTASFTADVPHTYSATGSHTTRFALTVFEPVGRRP